MRLKTNQLNRLKLSERRLASLMKQLPGFVYRCKIDSFWTTLYISERCRYVTGYESTEFIKGRAYNDLILPEYHQYLSEAVNAALKADDFFNVEYPLLHKSGEIRWVHGRGKGVFDTNGDVLFLEGYVEDITKRKNCRRALIIAKEKAEESNRLKTAFLANMSHEIRTPMNGVLGFLELLHEPDLSEENKMEYLRLMNLSGRRLLNTINDIIEISKIESGELPSNKTEFDLRKLFKTHLDIFTHEARQKNLRLYIGQQIETNQAIVITDKHKLDGILTNLVKNALKFTKSGSVEINNNLEGQHLVIWVRDTGQGIPAHKQKTIFDRFMQVDNSYVRDYEGSGLGLAIVKSYTDALKGTVHVESKEGTGSTFYVRIPLTTETPVSRNENDDCDQASAESPSRICACIDLSSVRFELSNVAPNPG